MKAKFECNHCSFNIVIPDTDDAGQWSMKIILCSYAMMNHNLDNHNQTPREK